MLEQVLDSEFSSMVLAFLLLAPPRAFSDRELCGRLGITAQKMQASLIELLENGYVKCYEEKDVTWCIVDLKNPVLLDVQKGLLKTTKPLQDEFYSAAKKLKGVKALVLSGVFVGKPELPVDLFLVGGFEEQALLQFLKNSFKLFGQEIRYCVMDADEYKFRRHGFDKFLKDIFDYRHIVVFDDVG